MKKIFTLCLLFAASLKLSASDHSASISITSARDIHQVIVDGRTYSVRGSNQSFELRDLRQGYHSIRVYRLNSAYRNPSQSRKLVYEGRIYTRIGYHTDIMINRFGRAYVDAQKIVSYHNEDYPYYETGYYSMGEQAMSNSSFQQLKATLKDEKFDQTRAAIAKAAMNTNFFETSQVKELLQLFSFENTKLELAKLFYEVTTDKENFIMIYDVFSFSSSKEELSRFLSTKSSEPEHF